MATRNPLAAAARGAGAIQTSSSREERAPGAVGAAASGAMALAGNGESVETANPLALRRAGTFRVVAGCSLKEALRYMDDLHPRRKDEFYEDTIEEESMTTKASGTVQRELVTLKVRRPAYWSVCGTRAGRFCPEDCCDPCREGNNSDLRDYGSAVTSYFKGIKWLIIVTLLLAIIQTPSLLVNTLGSGYEAEDESGAGPFPSLFRTTIGNLYGDTNGTVVQLSSDVCDAIPFYSDCRVPKSDIALLYGLTDAFGCFILLLALKFLYIMQKKEGDMVDESQITIDDYSVFLPQIPRWCTEEHIRAHFDRVLRDERGQPFQIAQVAIVEDKFELLSLYFERGSIIHDRERVDHAIAIENINFSLYDERPWYQGGLCCSRGGKIKSLKAELAKLKEDERKINLKIRKRCAASKLDTLKIDLEEEELLMQTEGNKGFLCWGRSHRIAELKWQIREMIQEMGGDETTGRREDSVAAFVTFELEQGYVAAQKLYPDTWMSHGVFQDRPLRLQGRTPTEPPTPLRVVAAPAPSTVLWENLTKSRRDQCLRQTMTLVWSSILLFGSFIFIYFASVQKDALVSEHSLFDCRKLAMVMNATGLELRTPYGGFDPTLQPVWPRTEQYLQQNFPTSELLDTSRANSSMVNCYCRSISWSSIDAKDLASFPDRETCPQQFCPIIAVRDFQNAFTFEFCLDWLERYAIQLSLTVAASVSITLINILLSMAIRYLAEFEAHYTLEDRDKSQARMIFLSQFFNTAILTLLVNTYVEGITPESGRDRAYDDFSRNWYAFVGVSFIITIGVQSVLPHFITLVMYAYVTYNRSQTKAPSQRDLNILFVGPAMQFPLRWAQLSNIFFVCLTYSTGVPLLLWMAFAAFFLAYWMDKYFFLRLFTTPPAATNIIQTTMTSFYPLAVLIHAAMGIWMLGNKNIFRVDGAVSDLVDQQAGSVLSGIQAGEGTEVAQGTERMFSPASAPLSALFLLLIFFGVVRQVLLVLRRVAHVAFVVITCGLADRCCAREDELEGVPPFSQAIAPNAPPNRRLFGMNKYSMLLVKSYQDLFGVDAEWAAAHNSLSDLAEYSSDRALALAARRRSLAASNSVKFTNIRLFGEDFADSLDVSGMRGFSHRGGISVRGGLSVRGKASRRNLAPRGGNSSTEASDAANAGTGAGVGVGAVAAAIAATGMGTGRSGLGSFRGSSARDVESGTRAADEEDEGLDGRDVVGTTEVDLTVAGGGRGGEGDGVGEDGEGGGGDGEAQVWGPDGSFAIDPDSIQYVEVQTETGEVMYMPVLVGPDGTMTMLPPDFDASAFVNAMGGVAGVDADAGAGGSGGGGQGGMMMAMGPEGIGAYDTATGMGGGMAPPPLVTMASYGMPTMMMPGGAPPPMVSMNSYGAAVDPGMMMSMGMGGMSMGMGMMPPPMTPMASYASAPVMFAATPPGPPGAPSTPRR